MKINNKASRWSRTTRTGFSIMMNNNNLSPFLGEIWKAPCIYPGQFLLPAQRAEIMQWMEDKAILFWAIVVVQRKYIIKSVATYPLHTFLELVINKKRQKFRWLSIEIEEVFKFLKEKWWEVRKKMGAWQIIGLFATCKLIFIYYLKQT